MALNSLYCADVPLSSYSLTAHHPSRLTQRRARPYCLEPVWLDSKDFGVRWVGSLPKQ